jgi:predicted metalloprotease with PDZ domain
MLFSANVNPVRLALAFSLLLGIQFPAPAAPAQPSFAFTVSVPERSAHLFHVEMLATGLSDRLLDFEMPEFTPGFYRLIDYAKNVRNFSATDAANHALPWEKVGRHTWRVATNQGQSVLLKYDVYAFTPFVAQSFLDDNRGYITPAGLYFHVSGMIQSPASVTFQMPEAWKTLATGLAAVPGKPFAFRAASFDVLYDCPTLMGNQETLAFDVKGIPHQVVLESIPAEVNRANMVSDLKRIVESATRLMGDIPYSSYTFLVMGIGNGGIEHLNSAAISFDGKGVASPEGYHRFLSFVGHEYFHTFNVKRIRPLALGPFDYETENITSMLWVSEGLTVYYQDLLLVRAGLTTPSQYLDELRDAINRYDSQPGRRYQSAAEASLAAWISGTSGVSVDHSIDISYYDNGAILGALLDLRIRTASANKHSLDDVMRALYRKYYLTLQRGFTGPEFRAECEKAAGADLSEVFSYAETSREIDYAQGLRLAGLAVENSAKEAKGSFAGLNTQTVVGGLRITTVLPDSPAAAAGLHAGDMIVRVEKSPATPRTLASQLISRKPGDMLTLTVAGDGAEREAALKLAQNFTREFRFAAASSPAPLETLILKDWLRQAQ